MDIYTSFDIMKKFILRWIDDELVLLDKDKLNGNIPSDRSYNSLKNLRKIVECGTKAFGEYDASEDRHKL